MQAPCIPTFILLGICLSPWLGAQQFTVLPPGYESRAGVLGDVPWDRDRVSSPIRAQYCYDSSLFQTNGIHYPIYIERLSWRALIGTGRWNGGDYLNTFIEMSSAATDYTSLSDQFDLNHGGDRATVSSGIIRIQTSTGSSGTPGPWYVQVSLATPFLYDPTLGADLLLDLHIDGSFIGMPVNISARVDTAQGSPDPIGIARLENTSDWMAATGDLRMERAPVLGIEFVPGPGLHAIFAASPASGNSPLSVSFTDRSACSHPGGITSWAWDFDSDGTIDSTEQNPVHVYPTCGSYDVSLTVTDASHNASTWVQPAMIQVDPQYAMTADFLHSPAAGIAPLHVQFTDASSSTSPPTSWAWDFDGDGIVDSSLQNPSHVYTSPGTYDVTLTASNGCFEDTIVKPGIIIVPATTSNTASAEIFDVQFNEVRGTRVFNAASTDYAPRYLEMSNSDWQADPGRPAYRGNEPGFGCVSAVPGTVVERNWVDCLCDLHLEGSVTIMWWQRMRHTWPITSIFAWGGHSGLDCMVDYYAPITLNSWSIGVFHGMDFAATLDTWRHITIVIDDTAGEVRWYFEGSFRNSDPFTPGTHVIDAPNFKIGAGAGAYLALSRGFEFDDFRLYNRALSASEVMEGFLRESPSNALFDEGCPGPGGQVPLLDGNSAPYLGNSLYALSLDGAEPSRAAVLVLGTEASLAGGLPLALPFLGSGCTLSVNAGIALSAQTGSGSITLPVPLPGDSLLEGVHVYMQALVLGSTGAASPGLDINLQF